MIREFKIISMKETPSSRRIDDFEVLVDVQVIKKWETGDSLFTRYEDETVILNLSYPIRNFEHLITLIADRKTGQTPTMGHKCLMKLRETILELIRKDTKC
jgi:hypothetical protein